MFDSDKLSDRQMRGFLVSLPLIGLFVIGALLLRDAFHPKVQNAEVEAAIDSAWAEVPLAEKPFAFDPNTVTYTELRSLGWSKALANRLLHYRGAGKIFRIKEDVATIYGMTDSMYLRFEPWIKIAPEYAYRPRAGRSHKSFRREEEQPGDSVVLVPFRVDTVQVGFLERIGFSERRAETFVSIARKRGFKDIGDFAHYPYFTDSMARVLEPYMIFPAPDSVASAVAAGPAEPSLVELNTADSAALRGVHGIGAATVGRILHYRERLGGFFRAEQLSEVEGVTPENLARILPQVTCDPMLIRKIQINRAAPADISDHPYLRRGTVNRLLSRRQLLRERRLPAWTSIQDMIDQRVLSSEEAYYLRPYLSFE